MCVHSLLSPALTAAPELGQDLPDRGTEVMPPESPIPLLLGHTDVPEALH